MVGVINERYVGLDVIEVQQIPRDGRFLATPRPQKPSIPTLVLPESNVNVPLGPQQGALTDGQRAVDTGSTGINTSAVSERAAEAPCAPASVQPIERGQLAANDVQRVKPGLDITGFMRQCKPAAKRSLSEPGAACYHMFPHHIDKCHTVTMRVLF